MKEKSILKCSERSFIINGATTIAICKFSYNGSDIDSNLFSMNRTFKGIARLSEGDRFDARVGERVAYAKAKRAALKYVHSELSHGLKKLDHFISILGKKMSTTADEVSILEKRIKGE